MLKTPLEKQPLDPPLRGETFSAEHLWEHAQSLAGQQEIAPQKRLRAPTADRQFIDRFESNCLYIAKAYQQAIDAVREGEPMAPDAEWLIDNYYVVEEQLREIREDLPGSYYRELPKLNTPRWRDFPRVWELAYELVVHTDSSLDEELIAGFVSSYQRITALTSGEIWAIPIMLRLVLVENLRRLCGHMVLAREARMQAQQILEDLQVGGRVTLPSADLQECSTLVMTLIEQLRDTGHDYGVGMRQLVECLGRSQEEIDDCVRHEQQRLAANQVSIGNLITSMRLLTALDWTQFFERVSLVDQVLRRDPAGVYGSMDFATRDQYRHEVEHLAKHGEHEEIAVATTALDLATRAQRIGIHDSRQLHVGYFLIDDGRNELERELNFRPTLRERLTRAARRHPNLVYLSSIGLLATCASAGLAVTLYALGASALASCVIGALAILPASDLAIGTVNFWVSALLRPRMLPKLEFLEQIPVGSHAMVVMPTLLTSEHGARFLLERLEIHYLANPERGLTYALLTDFADAPQEHMPEDKLLLSIAQGGIDGLNQRYAGGGPPRFYLFHRRRRWNANEALWMGWERKRGKLVELNRLLRGATDTSFITLPQRLDGFNSTKYVITLDADTRLPHAGAKRLVGALAHPLNRPHFDPVKRRVTFGYGVLQPRVSVSLASASRSLYAKIFANGGGLDPYCTAVSDVYQDLYGEGSYTGKGIYDVDAFTASVDDAFPENHILSHDLIEGCFARTGLVTDIEVFDEYPDRLDMDVRRQHRWARGDWQLLPWLRSKVPTPLGLRRNPLTLYARWKLFDNLRRSLVPLALVLLLISGWFLVPQFAWLVSLAGVTVLFAPFISSTLAAVRSWPSGDNWRQQLDDSAANISRAFLQCLLTLSFLPYRAQNMTDAAVRTIYRLFVSRQHLLEWETADATERRLRNVRWAAVWAMAWIPAMCLFVGILLVPPAWAAALPILLLWFASPAIAHYISLPTAAARTILTEPERKMLRRISRRTWAFFEAFVGAEDNWLPPDNFQEFPKPKIAHRISPTNEGLFILSAITAHDLGYVGQSDLALWLERNLQTLLMLPQYRGHFYNWYDTTTLTPLTPRYISTADSGNLAACLLTAQQALIELLDEPIMDSSLSEGMLDTIGIAEDAITRLQPRGARFVSTALDALESKVAELRTLARTRPADPLARLRLIHKLRGVATELPRLVEAFGATIGLKAAELSSKIQSLKSQIEGLDRDAGGMLGWILLLAPDAANDSTALTNLAPPTNDTAWQKVWSAIVSEAAKPLGINQVAALPERFAPHLEALLSAPSASGEDTQRREWVARFAAAVEVSAEQARRCRDRFLALADRYEMLAMEMDFTLLYNQQRRLFTVGYNLDEARIDRAHYDLLASESRIASLVAIAKGDADHRHWFQLGRAMTETGGGTRGLLSWGGTMFEYLMAPLFMRDVPGSLLDRSCRAAVARQIAYGKQRRVPWGISESAFSAMGANSDYHYQSFGVPGLGLKRGLGKDLVISPYSTALAAMINAPAAVANFEALMSEGAEGPWGFYDAVDYTPERVPAGERRTIVYNYMAHHQGMVMVALSNCLLDHRIQRRFQRLPLARSIDLLLQERLPMSVLQFQPQDDSTVAPPPMPEIPGPVSRRIATPATNVPRAHLLSNGHYMVMVTNAGGGFSSCRGTAVTRWRSDTTLDNWGQFIYLRDVATERLWSAAHQPIRAAADAYEVTYSVDKAEFRRRDGDIESHLEVAISPESNTEIRQLTITNHGRRPVTIEATSYCEVVLSPPGADISHPAFNKLFVETEYLPDCRALLATRRPRDAGSPRVWAVHVMAALPHIADLAEFETDRARFLGRGRTPAAPAAMLPGARLSGTTGPVLDPIFSLRSFVQVGPDESASLAFVTAFAESREEALQIADQYRDPRVVQRSFEMAWAHSQVEMRHLHVSPASVQLFQRLGSAVMFPDSSLRAPAEVMEANRRGQRALWRYGISGDDPIVLLSVSEPTHRGVMRELLLAHEFWHLHGLKADLVVVNEHPAGYFDEFQEQLQELIHTTSRMPLHHSGGVYLLRMSQLAPEDMVLLQTAAAVNLHAERGPLGRQLEAAGTTVRVPQAVLPVTRDPEKDSQADPVSLEPLPTLRFGGSLGGFTEWGDYLIHLRTGQSTPQPWSNVVANPDFGFLVTESGGGYTWAGNSRENKLTRWSNDPVSDVPSEILYLRDEETRSLWMPTPAPLRDSGEYRIEHGRGWSRFTHHANGIRSELQLSIAQDACVKFACLKLRNDSGRVRRLSATYYAEWVLGAYRQQSQMHLVTSRDAATGALVAQNRYHEDYPEQLAFLHVLGGADCMTGDRAEFLGRNGSYRSPDALRRVALSGMTGPGHDPCGAVQKKISIPPGEEVEIVFLLGWSDGSQSVADVVAPFASADQVHASIEATTEFWRNTLSTIKIETPNPALDLLVNEWLPYQTLSCRVWGRSAFYQSGGAFGFRDQLQDVMAVAYSKPEVARGIILQAASRQFEQGDVQHWWHPPSGRGVRTRFADDYLWLPYVVSHYVMTTGDTTILGEQVPYVHSYLLEPHEEERYELPETSPLVEDLYSHCLRAIDHGFRFGSHGLPLMGCGDWNDGMNKVGAGGKGESVWMGWFLRVVLLRFAPFVESRGDSARAAMYRSQADTLLATIEREAWDGKWYRRAFFDDGTPLGSHESEECRIDSIAQSWSVIAGADRERRATALRSLEEHLVRRDDGLVLLLTPPFDKTALDPGYIKGYPPGIRENGGQYTHAALWAVQALALEGHGTRAVELFDILNPVLKFGNEEVASRYQTEPYAVAADVYSQPPHVGRGGWTWYTGSSAWMYRVVIESILGLQLHGDELRLSPSIPANWPEFAVTIRRGKSQWRIRVSNPDRVECGSGHATIDGVRQVAPTIQLTDDGRSHVVEFALQAARNDSSPADLLRAKVADEQSGNGTPRRREQVAE